MDAGHGTRSLKERVMRRARPFDKEWSRKLGVATLVVGMYLAGTGRPGPFAQGPPAGGNPPEITFARDVAPLFQAKCQICHRPGEIAPMSLLTYAEVRPWARSIKAKVLAREMPPWFVDTKVGIQKFKNDASLSDQQIETIVRWVDSGTPLGNPADLPPPNNGRMPMRGAWPTLWVARRTLW
jgi:hypothetical protein